MKRSIFLSLLLVIVFNVKAEWFPHDSAVQYAQREEWQKSLQLLNTHLIDNSHDASALYDAGVAAYQCEQYQQAQEYFKRSANESGALQELKERALFNEGNAYVAMEKYADAVKSYEAALAIDGNDERAQHNLEKAKELLKKQQQQEQDQQQKDEQQKQNDDNDKDKQQNNKDQKSSGQNDSGKNDKDQQQNDGDGNQQQSSKSDAQKDESNRDDSSDDETSGDAGNESQDSDKNGEQDKSEQKKQQGDQRDSEHDFNNEEREHGNAEKEKEQPHDGRKDDAQRKEQDSGDAQQQQKKNSAQQRGDDHEEQPSSQKDSVVQQPCDNSTQEGEKEQELGVSMAEKDAKKAEAKKVDAWLCALLDEQEKRDAAQSKNMIKATVQQQLAGQDGEHCW